MTQADRSILFPEENMRLQRSTFLIPLVFAIACENAQGPADPQFGRPQYNTVSHAKLTVTKTATPYWRRDVTYDWSLVKSVTPASAEIGPNSTVTLNYTLAASRVEVGNSEAKGVSGQICVKNEGLGPTAGLEIYDEIQSKNQNGTWVPLQRVAVDVSGKPVLDAGEEHCYNYDIQYPLQAGVEYRNEAGPSITNWDGTSLNDRDFRVEAYALFTGPSAATGNEIDETALLNDLLICPTGFTCSDGPGPWTLTGSQTIQYAIQVTNVNALCGHTTVVENTARVTAGDSGDSETDSESVTVTTPDCEETPPDFQGCTPGYWKQQQHFGSWIGYVPTGASASKYNTVFGVNLFSANTTLLDALGAGGGGLKRFGRHSTAALLSASNDEVSYGMSAAQVILAVQNAVASGNMDAVADDFERRNERQCPLGRDE